MKKLRELYLLKNRKKLGVISTTVLVVLIILPITLVQSQVTFIPPQITLTQPPITIPQVSITYRPDILTPISIFAPTAPIIDGTISPEEWGMARQMKLDHGYLLFQNDVTTLYLAIDLINDTVVDPPTNSAPWGDYFQLAFDVMADEKIIPNKDLVYGLYSGTNDLGLVKYVTSNSWTGMMDTYSQLGVGYGPSMNSNTFHRIWEFAISLPEIQIGPGGLVRFGIQTISQTPHIYSNTPANFLTDFSNLLEIKLANARVDLLILTHEYFYDALKPLKVHKDSTGLSTYIQTWQNIDKSFGSQGRDEAERIKKAISFYEKYCDTKYVMLVGDSDKFPIRYTMTDRGVPEAFNRAFYPTDLYYADLYKADGSFDTWDSNNNGYYGELHGESIAGTINVDQVNLTPDIAVGRIPASTSAEATKYVNKVISYEFEAYQADWLKKILLIATTNWVYDACQTNEDIISSMPGFIAIKQYQPGNPCMSTFNEPTPSNINSVLDGGVGFVNYIGHGGVNEWQIPGNYYQNIHIPALTNTKKLPIIFTAACSTSAYATLPPYQSYKDLTDQLHLGTNNGENFTNIPPQPACLQTFNPDCFGEAILVKFEAGAIAYMGCATGAQPNAMKLSKYFFESVITTNPPILGLMWNEMITKYYQQENIPASLTEPDWTKVAAFHHPWKYHLFGDPSLRVGGIMQPIRTATQFKTIFTLPPLTFPEEPISFVQPKVTIPSVTSPGIPITFIPIIIPTSATTTSAITNATEVILASPVTKSILTKTTEPATNISKTQPVTLYTSETSETPQSSGIPAIPGFGPLEVFLAIIGLLVYIRRQSKR